MKKFFMIATVVATQIVLAHGDHKTISMPEAIVTARIYADQLVSEKKLVDTWKGAVVSPTETKETTISGKKRWSIVLKNEKEKDLSKSKLEVLMTPSGKVIEHNFKAETK